MNWFWQITFTSTLILIQPLTNCIPDHSMFKCVSWKQFSVVYLLSRVLLEFREVEWNEMNGQHVWNWRLHISSSCLDSRQCDRSSVNWGVDGKHEELVHIKKHSCCCLVLSLDLTVWGNWSVFLDLMINQPIFFSHQSSLRAEHLQSLKRSYLNYSGLFIQIKILTKWLNPNSRYHFLHSSLLEWINDAPPNIAVAWFSL